MLGRLPPGARGGQSALALLWQGRKRFGPRGGGSFKHIGLAGGRGLDPQKQTPQCRGSGARARRACHGLLGGAGGGGGGVAPARHPLVAGCRAPREAEVKKKQAAFPKRWKASDIFYLLQARSAALLC